MYNLIPTLLSTTGAGENTAAPAVSAVTPATRYSEGGQLVTIQGTDLKNPTGVTIDGDAVTVVSSSRYFIQVTTAAHTAGGPFDITVTTSLGSDTISGALSFVDVTTCTLTALSPDYGPASGGTTGTATGTFVPEGLAFTVNGVACTNVTSVNSTTATFVTPALANVNGAYDVVATMYGAGNTATLSEWFSAKALPTVTSVDVTTRPLGGTGTITVTGTNFVPGAFGGNTGTLGGTDVTLTYVSGTSLTFTAPALTAGAKDLIVTNIGGASAPLSGAVTYYAAPVATSVSPSPKTYSSSLTITGTGFTGGTGVTGGTYNGTPLTSVSVVDATTITATFAGETAGAHNLVLTGHPGGSSSALSVTAVNTNPVYTSVSPTSGATAGSTGLTVTGTGFSNGNATSVTIDGNACTSFSAVSDTSITCNSPAGTIGAKTLLVVGPAGNSNSGTFTYSGYSPLDDSPILWLRADMGVTTSGAEVTAWADQSGNGHDFVKGLVGPTVNTSNSDFNSQYTLHFAGGVSAECVQSSSTISYGKHVTCIVAKTSSGDRLYVRVGSAQLSSIYLGAGSVQVVSGDNSVLELRGAATFTKHASYARVLSHKWNGTNAGHLLGEDGTDFTMSDVANPGASSSAIAGTFYLMSYTSTSEYVAGDVAEVAVFPDGTDLTSFISYAVARYGL